MSLAQPRLSILNCILFSNSSDLDGSLDKTMPKTLIPSVLIPSYEPTTMSKLVKMCYIKVSFIKF